MVVDLHKRTNMGNFIYNNAQEFPERLAVAVQREVTYGELDERTNRLANSWMRDLGIQKGDKIAYVLENCNETAEVLVAGAKIGVPIVPMVTRRIDQDIEYLINLSDAKAVVFADDHRDRVLGMRANLSKVKHFIYAGNNPPGEGVLQYEELIEQGSPERPNVEVTLEDPAALCSTGGTTGIPKLGVHTHESGIAMMDSWRLRLGFRQQDVCLGNLPVYHAGGVFTLTLTSLMAGMSLILMPRWDVLRYVESIEKYKVTYAFLMPPVLWNQIMALPDYEKRDFSSIRLMFLAGGLYDYSVIRKRVPGVELYTLYSQSEHGDTCIARDHDVRPGMPYNFVGRVTPYSSWRIVDENDHDVPLGEGGELLVRGPGLISEYYNNEEETRQAFRGGWFHTGDMLKADEKGNMYFVGRVKDLVKSGGENVYAEEVEGVIIDHPQVRQVSIIGVPSERWGEEVVAVVVPEPGTQPTEEEIIGFCRGKLAGFQIPKKVYFVDQLPVNPVGKIMKSELRERFGKPVNTVSG